MSTYENTLFLFCRHHSIHHIYAFNGSRIYRKHEETASKLFISTLNLHIENNIFNLVMKINSKTRRRFIDIRSYQQWPNLMKEAFRISLNKFASPCDKRHISASEI